MSIHHLAAVSLVLGLLLPSAARPVAVPIDGALDPDYGVALSTQTNATVWWPDASLGLVGGSNGYELDQAYGFVSDGTLHLFLAGNLLCQGNPVDPGIFTYNLYLFIDSGVGGQNRLRRQRRPGLRLPRSDGRPDLRCGLRARLLAGLSRLPG